MGQWPPAPADEDLSTGTPAFGAVCERQGWTVALSTMVVFMLLMASPSENRNQESPAPMTTSIVCQQAVILCKKSGRRSGIHYSVPGWSLWSHLSKNREMGRPESPGGVLPIPFSYAAPPVARKKHNQGRCLPWLCSFSVPVSGMPTMASAFLLLEVTNVVHFQGRRNEAAGRSAEVAAHRHVQDHEEIGIEWPRIS
jgi:hypothetical protein